MRDLVRALPKAELHVHIEGTLEPELMFRLAERNGVEVGFRTVDEVHAAYRFLDLQSFLDIYYRGAAVLRTAEDFTELMLAYLARAAADGVRHAEVFFDPQTHTGRDVGFDVFLPALHRASVEAEERLGITSSLIMCFLRHLTAAEASATLETALPYRDMILGVGLDSTEVGHPPIKFADVFQRARQLGLRVVAHAGEEAPASHVWGALDILGAERIDHGVRSEDDTALVERLVEQRIPLTMCPLSNLALHVVDRLEDHNLKRLLDRGVVVTINSDDPAYFGGYLLDNYVAAAAALDLSAGDICRLTRNSIEASFMGEERKERLVAELLDVAEENGVAIAPRAMTDDLVVRGTRVALPVGLQPAAVTITGGRITGVVGHGEGPAGATVLDAGDRLVFPGLVDSHVHVNEPGRTHWEGFATATRAASAGGTTAIVDMPLNSIPPTIDRASLAAKRRAAMGQCAVDVAFWGGLTPDSVDEIEALAGEGVCGFKAFLVDSGVSEFPPLSEDVLRKALPKLRTLGLPLLVHAELPGLIRSCPSGGSYLDHVAARPSAAEDGAVKMMTDLVEETGAAVHILHLASGDAVELIAAAQKRGLPITAETCPHYLVFAAEDIDPRATLFKCAPPIRERRHRELLWEGLAAGTVGMVVSDHSPVPPEMKQSSGDFAAAWGGISSLQLRLAATWTAAAARGIAVEKLVGWLATAPARLAGLDKGTIEPGKDADLIVWDPDAEFTVEPAGLHHRHPGSPYEGMTMRGVVETTIVRGRVVARSGEVVSQNGALLAREHR